MNNKISLDLSDRPTDSTLSNQMLENHSKYLVNHLLFIYEFISGFKNLFDNLDGFINFLHILFINPHEGKLLLDSQMAYVTFTYNNNNRNQTSKTN